MLATHNRAEVLRETLEAFCGLDRSGIEAQFVVIDNNSSDSTAAVVESFQGRLPLIYFFEPRPGKNCALNRGIENSELGEIVVFTDDDVSPPEDWLLRIVEGTERYPEFSVFGGKIDPRWPDGAPPAFADDPFILMFGFSKHAVRPDAGPYPPEFLPFGPNFWAKRDAFQHRFRYNEDVGPRPKLRIMGSESTFLGDLRAAGYPPFYFPAAVVEHRIEPRACTRRALCRRAVRLGRGELYMSGVPKPALRSFSLPLWQTYAAIKAVRAVGTFTVCMALFWNARMFRRGLKCLQKLGNALECLRVGQKPLVGSRPLAAIPTELTTS